MVVVVLLLFGCRKRLGLLRLLLLWLLLRLLLSLHWLLQLLLRALQELSGCHGSLPPKHWFGWRQRGLLLLLQWLC